MGAIGNNSTLVSRSDKTVTFVMVYLIYYAIPSMLFLKTDFEKETLDDVHLLRSDRILQ
jgi:hypothetical protein